MGTGIKGFKSQKMLKSKLNGYSESQSVDVERYATIQELTGDRHAVDVMIHGAYTSSVAPMLVEAGSNIRVIKITAHGAVKGDFVKFVNNAVEVQVLSVPDVDTMILATELSFDPTGLQLEIIRSVTPSYNKDGSLNVSVTPSPVAYNRKESGVTVATTVLEDIDTPANSRGLPVTIHSLDGAPINVTAGDLNVHLSHTGVNFDSTRIGDGANLLAVTASNEAKVSDATAATKLDTLHSDLGVAATKLDTIHSDLAKDTNGNFPVGLHGLVDAGNSTSTILGALGTFTGAWRDVRDFNAIALGIVTDVDSAVDGVKYQFSADGINVHHEHTYTYTSGGYGTGYSVPVEFKYYRIQYVNGGSAQNVFFITSTLKQTALFPSSYKVTQAITGQTQALFTRGVIVGETTGMGGGYVNVKVNPSGALTVDATISSSALPTGAATAARQDTGNNSLSSIDTKLSSAATSANQVTGNNSLSSIDTKLSSVATSAKQDTGNSSLSSIDTKLSSQATAAKQDTGNTSLNNIDIKLPASLGAKASTASLSVVPASDAVFTVSQKVESTNTISSAQATVGVTAVRATVSGSAPSATRKKLWIKPSKNNTGAIYIGGSSVTILNGMEIIGPDRWEILNDANDWYLISDTAGQVVEIIEVV